MVAKGDRYDGIGMMAMMSLVIDCYNLLHMDMPVHLAGLDETRLCRLLGCTAWAGRGIVVVCDGRVKPHGPLESPEPSVDLVYSGHQCSADDVIVQMIQANTAPRRLTVVSSDRQIQKAARRRRCRVLSSVEFVGVLSAAAVAGKRPGGARGASAGRPVADEGKGTGPLNPHDVQQWLKRFGVDSDDRADSKDRTW